MRRNLNDARTYHNRYGLTCHQFVHLVCSFYFLIVCCMKPFFSFDLIGFCFVLFFPLSLPRLIFEHECVDLVHTMLCLPLPPFYCTLTFCAPTKNSQKEPVFLLDVLVSEVEFCCTPCLNSLLEVL